MRSNLQERVDGVKLAAAERTFRRYGLSDLFRSHDIAPAPPGFYPQAVSTGKAAGDFLRDFYFGSPLTFVDELRKYKADTGSHLGALRKYYKNMYLSPGAHIGWKLLSLGLPAAGLIHTLAAGDPRTRREDLATNITGLLTSPITARFGMPGAAAQALISAGAGRLAKATKDEEPVPVRPAPPDVRQYGEFE